MPKQVRVRQLEITDNLAELLIHIAHRVGVRAEEKVDSELMKHAKKVMGKAKLLYKLAKAAKEQPEGTVKLVTRASYSHHYRRIVPALLEVLNFQCNNDLHRPVMDALAPLEKYAATRAPHLPRARRCP